jgi:hypothetical protein
MSDCKIDILTTIIKKGLPNKLNKNDESMVMKKLPFGKQFGF